MNKKTKIAKDENSIKQEASKKTPELKKKKKKLKKNISSGIAYVYSTFNNTIASIDENGNVISCHLLELKVLKVQENPHRTLLK